MDIPIKTIKTPKGDVEVKIKEWITGREREYIDGGMLSTINAKPHISQQATNMDIDKMNLEKMTNETKHRAIKSYVTAVGSETDKEKIVDAVLNLHEDDTSFILEQIDLLTKKKEK